MGNEDDVDYKAIYGSLQKEWGPTYEAATEFYDEWARGVVDFYFDAGYIFCHVVRENGDNYTELSKIQGTGFQPVTPLARLALIAELAPCLEGDDAVVTGDIEKSVAGYLKARELEFEAGENIIL